MRARLGRMAGWLERRFAPAVVLAGAVGLVVPGPGRALARHHLIPALLAVLVLVSALGIEAGFAGRVRGQVARLGAVLATSTVAGIAAAWAVSHLVGDADLRHGVLALGVAPAEIATVAMAGLAGADPAVAAALLVGSTAVTVLTAGPVLGLLGGSAVDTGGTVAELGLVVGAPLCAGLALRRVASRAQAVQGALAPVSIVVVLALVVLVAAQIHLAAGYAAVAVAIAGFVVATTAIGLAAGRLVAPQARPAVVLSVAVRDFAVASGVATAAFGPRASGPLGIYGIVALATGAGLTRYVRIPGRPR